MSSEVKVSKILVRDPMVAKFVSMTGHPGFASVKPVGGLWKVSVFPHIFLDGVFLMLLAPTGAYRYIALIVLNKSLKCIISPHQNSDWDTTRCLKGEWDRLFCIRQTLIHCCYDNRDWFPSNRLFARSAKYINIFFRRQFMKLISPRNVFFHQTTKIWPLKKSLQWG